MDAVAAMSGLAVANDATLHDGDVKRPIRFDPGEPSDPVAQSTTAQRYLDPTGAFKAGFWSGEPGRSKVHYLKDEFCVLLAGVVRLTDKQGQVQTYRAGDTFLIPNGFKGVWEVVEPVREFYAIHTPASQA